MVRLLTSIVIMTLVIPALVDSFYLSWYPEYAPAKTVLSLKPNNYYKPYSPYQTKPRKTHNSYYTGSVMIEDNQLCSKFQCDQKACCSGQCIQVFGMQMCIVVSNRYGYGRR